MKRMVSSFFSNPKHKIIFFDLETNGNRPFYKSAIMQMALSAPSFLPKPVNLYVFPYDNIIGATEIHQIDEAKIIANHGLKSHELLNYLCTTFTDPGFTYYFVAYNTFGFDQNVLENHFKHHQMIVPENWVFVDIMPYIQRYYPNIRKNGGYKLSNVFSYLKNKSESTCENKQLDFHTAHDDVYALEYICKNVDPSMEKLKPYMRGSYTNRTILKSPISAIAGYAHFFKFEECGILTISHLYQIYLKKCNRSNADFKEFIKTKIGIYSEFYIQKIVEQVDILDDLLG